MIYFPVNIWKHLLSCLQYYKQPELLADVLHYMNTTFTGLFSLECMMKLHAYGVKVITESSCSIAHIRRRSAAFTFTYYYTHMLFCLNAKLTTGFLKHYLMETAFSFCFVWYAVLVDDLYFQVFCNSFLILLLTYCTTYYPLNCL